MESVSRPYELTFILGEKTTPEEGQKKAETVKALIEKLDGKNTKEELWGRRELAYIIKHNRTGFYITLWFDFPTTNLIALEQELRFDESIIRFLTTQAYTTAQPGTLYPDAEQEQEDDENSSSKGHRKEKEEKISGEEELRRSTKSTTKKPKKEVVENSEDEIPEEERLEKIDEALEVMLKDQE